jgi:hypothetical protein
MLRRGMGKTVAILAVFSFLLIQVVHVGIVGAEDTHLKLDAELSTSSHLDGHESASDEHDHDFGSLHKFLHDHNSASLPVSSVIAAPGSVDFLRPLAIPDSYHERHILPSVPPPLS